MGVPATREQGRRRGTVVLPVRGRACRRALAVARRGHAADAARRAAGTELGLTLRLAAIWLVLFAVYAATLGLDSFGSSDYGGDEPHYLLTAKSLIEDGDFDVRNQRADRDWEEFYPYYLDRHGKLTEGRAHEPHGAGFPALIAPAFAIGGAKGVELFLAAIAALGGVLAYLLALRVVPDPWAIGATLAVMLSPPLLAYGSAVYPELPAATALAGAALLALRLQERISRGEAPGCFLLLGTLPWLGTKFVPAGVVIGYFAARTLWRARHRTLALLSAELALFSVVFYVTLNEALYDGPTPYSADVEGETATDASFPGGYLERAYRLVALMIDREFGLLRWAPVFVLAGVGVWMLVRTRREGLARALPAACARRVGRAPVRGRARRAAAGRRVPRAHDVRLLVPAAAPARRAAARGAARSPGACAACRARAPRWRSIGVAASVWLYADVRWGDGGLGGRPARRAVGAARGRLPVVRRQHGAVRGGGRDRRRARRPLPPRVAELAPERGRDAREVLRVAHERAAGLAAAVADRHLDGVDAGAPQREREHLRVVVVVADARLGERAAAERAVAALAVGDDRLHQRAEQRARQAVGERAVPRHAVAVAEEARADHVLGAPARDRLEHALEVGRVVLAVAVEVDGGVVAAVARRGEALAHCGAQPGGARVRDHLGARGAGDRGGVVARAVVDDERVDGHAAGGRRDARDDRADHVLLVQRRDDGEAATWV